MTKPRIDTPLKSFGATMTGIIAIVLGLWFFGEAPFNEKVDGRIELYLQSAAMSVYVDQVIESYHQEQAKKGTENTKLRTLLSVKMDVDEDEVHIELGKRYRKGQLFEIEIIKKLKEIEKSLSDHKKTTH